LLRLSKKYRAVNSAWGLLKVRRRQGKDQLWEEDVVEVQAEGGKWVTLRESPSGPAHVIWLPLTQLTLGLVPPAFLPGMPLLLFHPYSQLLET
jgi:hypothetical protein